MEGASATELRPPMRSLIEGMCDVERPGFVPVGHVNVIVGVPSAGSFTVQLVASRKCENRSPAIHRDLVVGDRGESVWTHSIGNA
jgi:hypothetical protein